jgi:ferredoxin
MGHEVVHWGSATQINYFFLLLHHSPHPMAPVFLILYISGALLLFLLILLFLPLKGARSFSYRPPTQRFHEADSVLSRRLLQPGTTAYDLYYQHHPEFKLPDDRSRSESGLLSDTSRYYRPGSFQAARANFRLIEWMGPLTRSHHTTKPGKDTSGHLKQDPEAVTRFLVNWMMRSGAHSAGVAPLKDYHLYSHKGRGPRNGEPVLQEHTAAVAITVEMDHRMMQSAPQGPSVMESSEQYLRSGILALKMAAYIRELGYDATAHIDGNYEVICPLVAVDAGLGTLGRMGLLMTPALGPRVRISVVTTDMPLIPSTGSPEPTTLHFCHLCKKCAVNCPVGAIPAGPRSRIEGVERWKIDSEKCYHFWTLSGTDCGRCITVCPYSHPDNGFHRFVRWGIKNNLVFRHLAIKLDDILYGRRPPIRPIPEWTDIMDQS